MSLSRSVQTLGKTLKSHARKLVPAPMALSCAPVSKAERRNAVPAAFNTGKDIRPSESMRASLLKVWWSQHEGNTRSHPELGR